MGTYYTMDASRAWGFKLCDTPTPLTIINKFTRLPPVLCRSAKCTVLQIVVDPSQTAW
jgi:hypothetical protein